MKILTVRYCCVNTIRSVTSYSRIGLDVKICKTKTKKSSKNKKPAKLQQPTAEAIKEQVSSEVDKQLPKKCFRVCFEEKFQKTKKRG